MATTKWHYAQTVNQQINPNLTKRNKWGNIANAVGYSTKYATGEFTYKTSTTKDKNGKNKTTVTTNFPYTVTAHDFRLNIPDNAYIKKVEIQVRMKASVKDANVEFPRGLMCIYGVGWSKHIDNTKGRETGWENGLYFINPKKNLSTSFETYTYTVSGDNIKKAGYTPANLNSTVAGIDLRFDDEDIKKAVNVYLRWVRIRVTYDNPTYTLVHDGASTSSGNPRALTTGKSYTVKFTLNQSTKADGGTQCLKLDVPFGTKANTPVVSKGSFNSDTNIWTVNCNGVTSATLSLTFRDYTVDTQAITLSPVNCSSSKEPHPPKRDYWYRSGFGGVDDYGEMEMSVSTTPHKRHPMCFYVSSKVISSQDNLITIQFAHQSGFAYDTLGDGDNILNVEIYPQLTSDGVEFVSSTRNSATFRLPSVNEIYDLCFQYCLRPTVTGDFESICVISNTEITGHCPFTVSDPYEYHFGNKTVFDEANNIANYRLVGEVIGFLNHRVASELETGAYVLPCRVAEHDSIMKQSNPNIHMYKWEELDYIGCVPLEHLHFDPKSTYKDKLLDTHYKNKRYMGKELASDEDITLNVRLHPQQVTTIQGLIDMDKPIPINANHRCFEGDSLNHRGWAEIYSVTTTLTNPHWYKCDIDVKYLTHNLNTRFKINKGDKTFGNYTMPNLLLESVASGDALSSYGQEDAEDRQTDYFIVDTDGGYIYNSEEIDTTYYVDDDGKIIFYVDTDTAYMIPDIEREYGADKVNIIQGASDDDYNALIEQITEEGYYIISADFGKPIVVDDTTYSNAEERNIFSLEEGQHFSIKSRNTLSDVSQVNYDWSSLMMDENKENAVSKIVRLINKEDNITMFEYEYCDLDFSEYNDGDNHITVHVIGRAYRKGDYDEVINEDIRMPIIVDDDEEEDATETDENPSETFYGSSVSFQLNNHVLRVMDSGYTGNVLDVSNIELEGESYYYEVEWKNNNTDGETGELITYVDLTVQDSILASQYSSKYGNLVVAPFPVADKTMIFSRNGEEGTIYYYTDDKEEFSYLIEPYYQYHNGVDLRASVDDNGYYISVFNLNYGYKTIYLENGLVSLGIDRLTGRMYLRKWNEASKSYVSLFAFQLENYDDVNINSISDDKIELQASNTLISMYRGHPYVILKHELEDIQILSKFNRVWAEQVDDDIMQYPTYFDLMNTDNLLPACVGGTKTIDDDCVVVFECGDPDTVNCPDLTDVSIEMKLSNQIFEDEETQLNITTEDLNDGDIVYFIINGDVLDDKPMTYPTPVPYTFDENKEYEVSAVYVGNDEKSYAVAPTVTIHAQTRPPSEDEGEQEEGGTVDCPKPASGTYKLTINAPKTFKYMDGKAITYTLTRGGNPVCGKTVEKTDFTRIHSNTTRPNGTVTSHNNLVAYAPAKYKIGARFFEGGKQICKSEFKEVTIKKADLEWLCDKAEKTGKYVTFTLRDKDTKRVIANTKVTVYINGKAKTKKTNSKGKVSWKITKKDKYTYKCVFAGNKYYNKKSKSFKENIKK